MTRDEQKTKAELLQELDTLRRCASKLKQVEEKLKHSEKQFKELRVKNRLSQSWLFRHRELMSTSVLAEYMVKHGAVITGDTGPDHFGLKVFFIWSNLSPQDFSKGCGLRDLVKRKGRVLGDQQILYYAYKLYGMLEAIGDWKTPKLLNAPRIIAKCNVYHFRRFLFF